jgi:threonine/homoserine/homoserine lactone efflux protein
MIESIVSGIGLGFVLSFLTGPVFFALIKTSIEKGFYAGVSLAGGVLVSDIFYVGILSYPDKWSIYTDNSWEKF